MRFTKITFWIAGVWGFLVLAPMYFMYSKVGQYTPPSPTHPEFYYGFLGLALVWQFAFIIIATDPARFRPMIIPSIFEKALYVGALVVLYVQNRVTDLQLAAAAPDTVLCLLFVSAFFKTRSMAVAKLKESHTSAEMQ
jgi:hypothetical protein